MRVVLPSSVVAAQRTKPLVLEVIDVTGRVVKRLFRGPAPGRVMDLRWNGRDSNGAQVASGVYWLRASCGDEQAVARVAMLRR